jgi:hypothetical protein
MLENTHQGFSISFVTGAPGSGKSYFLARDVIKRLISSDAIIRTNLPLEVEKIAEFVAKRRKCDPAEVAERIKLLDPETLTRWKTPGEIVVEGGKRRPSVQGPWEFVKEQCVGADLILDEGHLYCPKKDRAAREYEEGYRRWLGEVRHDGWRRIVFVTQDESKVGQSIVTHAELRYELTNAERLRDPWFRIPMGDWYELRGSLSKRYRSRVAIAEFRRVNGKLRLQGKPERFALEPEWFAFYRSHEASGGGTGVGNVERQKRECETRSMVGVWLWFLRRHFIKLGGAAAIVSAFMWVTFFGGMRMGVETWLRMSGKSMASNRKVEAAREGAEVKAATAPPVEADGGVGTPDLKAAMEAVPEPHRAVISRAMLAAAEELRTREEMINALGDGVPTLDVPVEQLPPVRGFVGKDRVVIGGELLTVGDEILLDGGLRHVRIKRIDRPGRRVWLEDSRVLRFAVDEPVASQLPFAGGGGFGGGSSSTGDGRPVRAVVASGAGSSAAQPPVGSGRGKSVIKRPGNASGGVLPAAGR